MFRHPAPLRKWLLCAARLATMSESPRVCVIVPGLVQRLNGRAIGPGAIAILHGRRSKLLPLKGERHGLDDRGARIDADDYVFARHETSVL